MEPDEHRNITLVFHDNEFPAYLVRKKGNPSGKQTQIHWHADFDHIINEIFPDVVNTKFFPDMVFFRIDWDRYKVDFIGSMVEIGDIFVENGDLNTRAVKYDSVEGRKIVYYTTRYERDRRNREIAIQRNKPICQACGFSFEDKYGALGEGYIEVHHIKPLSSMDGETHVNPETDLICLCSNCHRMVHRRRGDVVTLEELQEIIALQKKIHKSADAGYEEGEEDLPIQKKSGSRARSHSIRSTSEIWSRWMSTPSPTRIPAA
jgi:5-methylcytosine-specific restriction protein A